MTLGEKIYALRGKNGLSQEAFGERLGVSRQSVSKWETDQSVPELEKIVAISELFGVSTDYLLKDKINAPDREKCAEAEGEQMPTAETSYKNMATGPHYEYKSKRTVRGLPLVHVNIGLGAYRAKGIVAIGNFASGIVAVGLLSAGIVSLGILSAGLLLAFGTVAVGLVSAGSFAVGLAAFGAITVGGFCMGAINFGDFCFGALSYGQQIAVGDEAHGRIALGFSRASGELYEEVSKTHQFDYQTIERLIDENISSGWLPFKGWMKGILHMMAKSV
ncbi:MAG: helix-turn-helix domain-containing protein [Roseburia sp.]|nr:helix-turn-helix domain-containing protein [Roseburia sp.]